MRIPYRINQNTHLTYKPSPESLVLVSEVKRCLLSENFEWDAEHCPSLVTFCVRAINEYFEKKQILNELPCEDRDHLLEILDTKLPLEIVLPLIDEEVYWKRRYTENYGTVIFNRKKEWTWKNLYIERYIQETLEKAQPEYNDEEELTDLLTLCAPYVNKLVVSQLQNWKPPTFWDEEDIPEKYPLDHINFEPIFKNLPNITELDIVFGMSNVTDNFNCNMFKLSVQDCQHLGKAVNYLKSLRVLKIHRSKLEDSHVRALMQNFVKNETVEELNLSHCVIGDQGALCVAKILCVHPKLRILDLGDNRIGCLGCEGLGFALLEPGCSLEKLSLKLNPLGEGGAMGIMRALVRGTKLAELSMAVCEYDDEAPIRTGQMLLLNASLKRLDVSNNWFDEEGGQALIDGLAINRTLEWLDIRETDIPMSQQALIKKYLLRNRLGLENIEDITKEIEAEPVSQPLAEAVSSQTTNVTNTETVATAITAATI